MEALAARGLDEGGEPLRLEARAHLARRGDHRLPVDALAGVEVEDRLVGALEIVEGRLPAVDLERAALDQPDQARQAVDGDERRLVVVAERVVEGDDLAALPLPGVLCEEALRRRCRPGSAGARPAG